MKPVIGITIGDPAGIGPEVVVKSLIDKEIYEICQPVVIGDIAVLEETRDILNASSSLNFVAVTDSEEISFPFGTIPVFDLGLIKKPIIFGRSMSEYGFASYMYIKKASELAQKGIIDAVATAPINKVSLKLANIGFIGHTEILSYLTGAKDPLTMFVLDEMRVFFLSRHVSLRQAVDMVKFERVLDYIERCVGALEDLGADVREKPFAVAGLNPHAGENGLFGDEEVKEVIPAIKEAQRKGINVVGPIGADSVFYMARAGKFSGVLSMYHDQGHIATKTVDPARTISLTLGMPFLRTSVDHGTAFDIAGKGIADETSMKEAIKVAVKFLRYKKLRR